MCRRALLIVLLVVTSVMAPIRSQLPRVLAAACSVTTTSDAGPGSLRQAITDANGNACLDATTNTNLITFNIAGAGVHTIVPGSAVACSPVLLAAGLAN